MATYRITTLIFNWRTGRDGELHCDTAQVGEEYADGTITEIIEHRPMGEGDKWYYDIVFESGNFNRVFTPHSVEFEKESNNE